MASRRGLLAALRDIRAWVALPNNNFDWSGWENAEEALAEIDAVIAKVRQGHTPITAEVLFLPTGPLQETSLSSGWGNEFVAIADRFDMAKAAEPDCPCYLEPEALVLTSQLGMDSNHAEVSVLHCPQCGQQWVRYFYEVEAFSKSGRWYLGAADGEVSADTARTVLEQSLEYWQGGSYFEGKKTLSNGPIETL